MSTATSTIPIRVRFAETDMMRIVHHASYLLYFEAARVEWLRRRGVAYVEWANRGFHTSVVESHIVHKAPSRFDDLLAIETTLAKLGAVSMKFTYRVVRGEAPNETVVAEGWTRLGAVDDAGKVIRIPVEVHAVLERGEIDSAGP